MVRRRLQVQRGIALPIVMLVIALILIFAAVAMSQASVGISASTRDARGQQATQAARAGLRMAIYRMNSLSLDARDVLAFNLQDQCVLTTSGGLLDVAVLSGVGNWCAAVTEDMGADTTFSYRVSPLVRTPATLPSFSAIGQTINITLDREIVSTGTAGGVSRRVYAKVSNSGNVHLLLSLLDSPHLQLYKVVPGSYRECSANQIGSTPSGGC